MTDEPTTSEVEERLRRTAEAVLMRAWGGAAVHLGGGEMLRKAGRNRVLRCVVETAPDGTPASVIVKASVGEGECAFDPSRDTDEAAAWRFYNEWASAALLSGLPGEPLTARLYGGDREAGIIVTEDLGEGGCLADRMQGQDRAALEAGLLAYARGLGRLHAATIGREAEFLSLRRSVGGSEMTREPEGIRWERTNVETFRRQCETLGVPLATGFEADVARVRAELDAPGPFLAFAPGDTCPDNHRFVGTEVRFFDFEFSGFRLALLDTAYLRAPFPTCWCVNRLPSALVPTLEAAYRSELSVGCPAVGDDARFFGALTAACAYWAVTSVSWALDQALEADGPWGISTQRQRPPVRLDALADASAEFGLLPALGETARTLAGVLRTRWSDTEPMPLYPAFRETKT
jgi:hypothetical protein